MATLFFKARLQINSPATTSVSLFASAIVFLALMAAIVGRNPENPTIIEDFIRAIGATPVVYPYRNECCGGYVSLREKEMAKNMCDKIKESAAGYGAEMLITACPLCMYNLKENATDGLTVPFHAGAAKYFKEKGIEVATK